MQEAEGPTENIVFLAKRRNSKSAPSQRICLKSAANATEAVPIRFRIPTGIINDVLNYQPEHPQGKGACHFDSYIQIFISVTL